MKLISPDIYNNYLEIVINQKWNAIKNANKNKDGKFLRWNMNTITQYNSKFKGTVFKDFNQSLKNINFTDSNISINSKEAIKIKAKNKVYMKPFYGGNDQVWLNIYEKYYKNNGFIFANLTPYAINIEKELNTKIVMEGGTHTGNTGGLLESIAIGKWIDNFYKNN